MKTTSRFAVFLFTTILYLMAASASAETKLLRFPDVHGKRVAFCHGGDIWEASTGGGLARRLSAHRGEELFPKFSPDGKWIAFTGQYDGDEQVYVMPASGGVPKQLTFYPARGPLSPRGGYDNQVYGWSPDGSRILFRSFRDADGGRTRTALYEVDMTGGLPRRLPMPTAGAGDFSPDGKKIVYSPLFRDFRTWKRYQGGWAQYLMLFDLESHDARKIAYSKRTERDPMWIGDTIYFVSDRDGKRNLYAYDISVDKTRQLTHHKTWDVCWAASDNKQQIVYQLNGGICLFDLKSGKEKPLVIDVPHDGVHMRPSRHGIASNIEHYSLSPKGRRALFVARGDLFTVPVGKGMTRNLTQSTGTHDKKASWSPDGKRIAFVSDKTGEDQVYVVDQDGASQPRQLTFGLKTMLYTPAWSSDGKHLLFSDKDGKLRVLTLPIKKGDKPKLVEIADARRGTIHDQTWSPKGNYVAYSMKDANEFGSIYIWSMADGKTHRVTDEYADEFEPVWDHKGRYLFFLARHGFEPQMCEQEWNYVGNRQVGIFALILRKDVKSPFAPENVEVAPATAKTKETAKKEEPKKDVAKKDTTAAKKDVAKKEATPKPPAIDFDGLARRVIPLPVEADNIYNLVAAGDYLLYKKRGARFYGRGSYAKTAIYIFDMKARRASTFVSDAKGYSTSRDGRKVVVHQGGSYYVYDVQPSPKSKTTVSTSGLIVDRVPAEEWAEIFDEVWRRFRDFFYVKNMHGYDWKAIGQRYRNLVPHVAHRSDLNYLIGEMIAELNIGHAYIQGGDYRKPVRPVVGLPGATFELDVKAKRFRIAKIYAGQNEESRYRSPLTQVGVDVAVGDYVLAIDGRELKADDNPYRLLQHKVGTVTLTLNKKPTLDGARKVAYQPIRSEAALRYLDWTRTNREKVAKATGSRVGYLHLPNMGDDGIREFIKWFYPQIRKEGLIVDVRANGGGNVSPWIIERLGRKLLGTRFGSSGDEPGTYPKTVFHGHMVCIINENSASDGDIFPYRFRQAGIGPLIGKRSWGGVVGISGRGPLIDGGTVYVPLNATNGPDGKWIIEGHGVDPDIEVDNDPKSVIQGRDPQLERAIAEVTKRIKADPKKLPKRPADPVKTK